MTNNENELVEAVKKGLSDVCDKMTNNENEPKTTIALFKEFFSSTPIKERLANEKICYISLDEIERFHKRLYDILLEKPGDVFIAMSKAIKEINLENEDHDFNIRIKDVPITPLRDITSDRVGQLVSTVGIIKRITEPSFRLLNGVFECSACMRLHEVEQNNINNLIEPSLCMECGSRSFRLLLEESEYIDVQKLRIKGLNTSREIIISLEGGLISFDKYKINETALITGILKIDGKRQLIYCNNIETCFKKENILPDASFELDQDNNIGDRKSIGYKQWMNDILNRDDSTCVICGEKRAPHVHHIFSYKNHMGYRLDVENGVVLCRWHHHKYHDIYGKETANPVSLIEFLKEELL